MADTVTTSTTEPITTDVTSTTYTPQVTTAMINVPKPEPDYKAMWEQAKAESRKWEDRSKENFEKAKAYDDLQAAAKAQEEANKTLEQQVADIRDQLNESNAANLKMKVANEKGIDARFLIGETEDELRSSADALIAWRDMTAPKPAAPIIPADGNTPANIEKPSTMEQFAHSFFGGN